MASVLLVFWAVWVVKNTEAANARESSLSHT